MRNYEIVIELIKPNPEQPRGSFDPEEMKGLSESILENGVIQPITIYKNGDGFYHIVDGERRWRAAKMAGLKTIPAITRDNGKDAGVLATVANIQREDLSPIEEAKAYQAMVKKGLSKIKIANRMGKSLKTINDRLTLLELDEKIQDKISKKELPSDARAVSALLSIREPEHRVKLAEKLARPGVQIKTVVTACEKLNAALDTKVDDKAVPVMFYAARKAGAVDIPKWDLLRQIDKVPPWPLVEKSATEICERCALHDTASAVICGECPAVLMVETLIRKVNNEC